MKRLALVALLPATLAGQGSGRILELHLGRWYAGSRSRSYEVRVSSPFTGGFTHSLAVTALVDDSLGRRRAFYGAGVEGQILRGRATFGPYLLVGAALGLSTDTSTQELALLWDVGGGVEWRPAAWLGMGAEVRYWLQDRGPRGFWRARPDARGGLSLAVGVSIGRGRRGRVGSDVPTPAPITVTVSGTAGDVVETALGVLGTPYQWGGTAENAFDCSGLVQYAYGQHGIRLPRRSRDQARVGAEVSPVVEALRPGDVLLFSIRPGAGVTHVGMYVGEERFIHSATDGVKLSRLDPHDPDGAYWLARWVGARRVIP